MQTITTEGVHIATGRPGDYAVAKVSAAVDNSIRTIVETSKYPLQMSQVLSFVEGKREMAAPLLAYHLSKTTFKPPIVFPLKDSIRRYQFSPGQFDGVAKPGLVPFMNPFVRGAFVPDQTLANEDQCVRERVLNVRPPVLPRSKFLARVMAEFVELVIPDDKAHILDPVDDDQVLIRQPRVAQRKLLEIANWMLPKRLVQSFIKKESYANVKPPRLISTINTVHKREYSKFMYAMEVVLKEQPWYAFAKTPRLIAQRVAEVLFKAKVATATDFSKFDGHGSNIMRELEKALLMRAFRVEHHPMLLELHHSQYELKAVATFGTKYDTAYSRASGSPETSLFNSLTNSFIAYLALRMVSVEGVPLSPKEAYARLGIYGGDDGVTADVPSAVYTNAAMMVGQQLTITEVQRNQPGIMFLARCYSPDVWSGDDNSCCDIRRQISKFHVSIALPSNVSPADKLLEKCRSVLLSDEYTPILGEYALTVARCAGGEIKFNERLSPMQTWLSRYEKKEQYKNHAAQWMEELVARDMADFRIDQFRQWLAKATTLDYLLAPPLFCPDPEVVSKDPVVVDGELFPLGIGLPPIDDVPYEKKDYRTESKYDDRKVELKESTKPERMRWQPKPVAMKPTLPPKITVLDVLPASRPVLVQHTIPQRVNTTVALGLEEGKHGRSGSAQVEALPVKVTETFEQCQARKKARGTWIHSERIPCKFRPLNSGPPSGRGRGRGVVPMRGRPPRGRGRL
nr:RNA-dependent RNA polymerase [Flumine noda-like virus 44]